MHASRFIAALACAAACGTAGGGAHAQTSPIGPASPLGAATPGSGSLPHGANADTPPPAVPGGPAAPAPNSGLLGTPGPLPPVHTMAPRPLGGGAGRPVLDPGLVPGSPALNGRALTARRTPTGYVLGGQAQVRDGCQAARFDASAPGGAGPRFSLVQYRNPANRGVMCTQVIRWVAATARTVTTAKPPNAVTVRTAAGTTRVPVR